MTVQRKKLHQLFFPLFFETLFMMLAGMVDTLMLSSEGDYAVGAVGTANTYISLFIIMFSIISSGMVAVMTQYIGAKRPGVAHQALKLGLMFNLSVGVVITGVLIFGTDAILKAVGIARDLEEPASIYLRTIGAFCICNPMGVEHKEKTKQAAAHQKRIAVRPLAAGIVSRVKGSGYLGVHRDVRVDRAGEAQGPHLQRGQNIAPCPVVFNLIVQKGEGEYDILVLHPHAGVAVDGVEFTGEDGHDGTGHDGIFAGSGGHCAAPFFDIDDLHMVVPVQIHPGKVLGDGTQVSVVGETRLLMQQGLSVL